MKNNWSLKIFNEIGKITNGNSINQKVKEENYSDNKVGLPYIATKDISYDSKINYKNGITIPEVYLKSFKIAKTNSLLICSEGGSAGRKYAMTNQDVCFVNKLFAVETNKEVLPKILLYYFNSLLFQSEFKERLTGLIGGVSINKFKTIPIPIPPLSEQQAIVEKLDFNFEAIEKAKANIEKNIQNATELFQSKLNEIFSQKGEGWEEKKIEEVCESIVAGGDAPKNNFSAERNDNFPIPIYANAVKLNGLYGYTDLCKIKKPSLTIAARGSGTGFTCIRLEPFFPIVRLLVLTPNESIDLQFLKLSVDNQVIKASGSAIPQFTVPMLKMLSIYLPKTLKEQEKIVSQLEKLSEQTNVIQEKYKHKIANLEELKKSTLEKAFKGELL